MSTPILTKKQQRLSLSAKKGPSRGLRNILAQPSENYWPTVNIDQCETLIGLMNKLLPSIKRTAYKLPGSMLRHMTKEQRAVARQEALEKETAKSDESMLKSVIIGINAITRALEKNKVCCVLLDASVEPPLLVKHIVIMARNKEVPILLLPTLKAITLQTIGFATAALALKEDVMQSSDNAFHALYQSVAQIFQNFVPSKCSSQLFKPDKASEESTMCKMEVTNVNDLTDISKTEKSVLTDVYKYRSSRNERAFVPPVINNGSQISQASPDEFISLDNNPDLSDKYFTSTLKNKRYVNIRKEKGKSEKKITTCSNESALIDSNTDSWKHKKHRGNHVSRKRKGDDITYLSLKIKRVQGNNNRVKATKFAKKKKK
ncbi:hypothetical protein DMN91_002143 [Ooceraea biroi]|uniref:Ribonuclease P protein subunit p38 n=1 Tax=Ooceraea biroi TaxID=2015173 RepID=A0A026WXH5_OOCBI|nr:uncharacterized protein LOC105287919 [Ooceraea biroi]XP_011352096.1 uncharacterized protein LOC105287919 [Ooceraea biroi]XP_026823657.1 uncharacterized protein LOC105287919 [Ooceraea biroi]EZA60727.1 Ribonuclease P protein subunit p38 [Ooceraea biroi]RLU25980.1 hypothetical protein DMN91_002143 [Ooceraea biroi]